MAGVIRMVGGLMQQARPGLMVFKKYALVELTPPKPTDLPAIKAGVQQLLCAAKSGGWKTLTVREAWLNTLIWTEVWMWFWAGECIGKRHLVGYNV